MIPEKVRMVANGTDPKGTIQTVRCLSPTFVVLTRTKSSSTFLLNMNTGQETPFPEMELIRHIYLCGYHINRPNFAYSPDLACIAWIEPKQQQGYVARLNGDKIGSIIHRWHQVYESLDLQWLPGNKTLMITEADYRIGEPYPQTERRREKVVPSARFHFESIEEKSSGRTIILPIAFRGSNPMWPHPVNASTAMADNLDPGPWDARADPNTKSVIGQRWQFNEGRPMQNKFAFRLPAEWDFATRVHLSDGETTVWLLEDWKRRRTGIREQLWISRFDGAGLRPLLPPEEERRLGWDRPFRLDPEQRDFRLSQLYPVPDRPTVLYFSRGSLYLIDTSSP